MRKVYSFLNSVELKDGPKACRFQVTWSHNQLNEGANPKTGRADRPIKNKSSRRGKLREGSWAGVTSGTTDHTCTTATALQLHFKVSCVCSLQLREMWVGPPVRSVEVTPSKSLCKRKTKGWNRDTAVSETTQLPVDSSGGLYDDQSSWPV